MPAPEPDAIDLGPDWPHRVSVLVCFFMATNRTSRKRRARAITRNLLAGGWLCPWCSGPVPLFRRADAVYCCEGCRKRAARNRKLWKGD